jgi:hypothetical protein
MLLAQSKVHIFSHKSVFDMNYFMNGLLSWNFDWECIDDVEDETGVLWIHDESRSVNSPVLEDEDGYSSEEIDPCGSRVSLNVERYR